MEPSTPTRNARTAPTCTAPGLLVGLTKLFSLTKVCAAPTPADDAAAAAADAKPGPGSLAVAGHGPDLDPRLVLVRLFDAVSVLKSGYVKLQRAHFPYDPAKVAAADEAVASELDSVAALQRLWTSAGCGVGEMVNDRWAQVQGLEAGVRRRDADVAVLRRELERLWRENARLGRRVRSRSRSHGRVLAVPREVAAPSAVVDRFVAAARSVGDFAELLATSLTAAAEREQARTWRRYSLEARVWRAMLAGGEEEHRSDADTFDRIMKLRDPLDALMQFPRSGLARFCGAAYLAAVPAEAEAAARRNLDQRAFVSRGGHPRTRLYCAFAAAARSVWALRVLMAAMAMARRSEQLELGHGAGGVRVFYARRGGLFAAEFMESVDVVGVEVEVDEKLAVAFTVTPGVKVGDTVVPCRVLLGRRRRRRRRDRERGQGRGSSISGDNSDQQASFFMHVS